MRLLDLLDYVAACLINLDRMENISIVLSSLKGSAEKGSVR